MKLWKYPDKSSKLSIASENPILAKLLAIRNIDTDQKVDLFLNPEKNKYIPFSAFNDCDKVIERIVHSIEKEEQIIIYGDFDTDGVTSTAILYRTLKELGAKVDYYLPDRDAESHGLNSNAIIKLIAKQKAKLIITVDCGISNLSEVKLANNFRTDIIITDHHEAPEILPEAYAIINPKAANTLSENLNTSEIEDLCYLSGAGIAFKLASALLEKYNLTNVIKELEPIAALGTIGDIVPLIGENRHIAYSGIKAVQNRVNKGITRLLENAGVQDFSKITSETIAFTAVPRINATGRLEKADIAFKLLISNDNKEIDEITNKLNTINLQRQKMCEDAFIRAEEIICTTPNLYKHSIVICDEDAHVGIIGLSASKLVEKYAKPAFIMKKDKNIYRCSCRGLQGINIYNILNQNAELFIGYGGHEFAGGFSFDENKCSFEKVREAINNTVIEQTQGKILPDILNIDININPEDVNEKLIETTNLLEPCGASNPRPIFSVNNIRIADMKFMGQNKNHLKLFCQSNNGKLLECIKWSTPEFEGKKNDEISIAFIPEINEFNGKISIQLLIKDFLLKNTKNINENSQVKIIDSRTQKDCFDKIYDFLQKTNKKTVIFAENNNLRLSCKQNGITENYLCERNNIPDNLDMIILAETPPSLNFIKLLIKKGTKEILFMKYNTPIEDAKFIIDKIAGMLKYTYNSLNGKTSVSAILNALNFDESILLTALKLFEKTGVIDFEINNNSDLILKNFSRIKKEMLLNNPIFNTFKKQYNEYYTHVKILNSCTRKDLKKYILE